MHLHMWRHPAAMDADDLQRRLYVQQSIRAQALDVYPAAISSKQLLAAAAGAGPKISSPSISRKSPSRRQHGQIRAALFRARNQRMATVPAGATAAPTPAPQHQLHSTGKPQPLQLHHLQRHQLLHSSRPLHDRMPSYGELSQTTSSSEGSCSPWAIASSSPVFDFRSAHVQAGAGDPALPAGPAGSCTWPSTPYNMDVSMAPHDGVPLSSRRPAEQSAAAQLPPPQQLQQQQHQRRHHAQQARRAATTSYFITSPRSFLQGDARGRNGGGGSGSGGGSGGNAIGVRAAGGDGGAGAGAGSSYISCSGDSGGSSGGDASSSADACDDDAFGLLSSSDGGGGGDWMMLQVPSEAGKNTGAPASA
ncbi:hypothetical protein JKP88DRAFT_242398 [Tribonema minus]|uniref:Uncharacterized protein n=1 Tax=Tribonema minus TaxID=303371 RepID=A0A836C9T2_9STRA|nr:hypothetical protein JKP88DRAFT_242398 [Tribonema minus]